MRVHIGNYIPPACESIAQASSTSCVVVPGITKGTLVMPDTPLTNVWAGQLVNITPQAQAAYEANLKAAQDAGKPIVSTADPGAVTDQGSESPTNASQQIAASNDGVLYAAAGAVALALIFG
jgi:hypothetical protein